MQVATGAWSARTRPTASGYGRLTSLIHSSLRKAPCPYCEGSELVLDFRAPVTPQQFVLVGDPARVGSDFLDPQPVMLAIAAEIDIQ